MKRTLSLVLALVMVLGSFGAVFGEKADLTEVVEAGAFLDSVGVLEGNDDGDLMLDETLLRRDMVVLLSRLMQVEETAAEFPSEDVLTFEDITDPYYNGYIAWSVSNKLIEGHSEKVFGFNENVTAQQYSTVLMRALGYEVDDVAYATILKQAADLGLWEGLELENDTEILRGQMAVMTVNALWTKMKDSEKTLAEELGIEMPEEKVLTAVVNDTENLIEVKVELSNAKLADKDKLEDKGNYKVSKSTVKDVTVDGDDVILLLEKALIKGRSYDLTIRGIDKAVDAKYSFVARDNASPRVEKVTVLGEYGIKVT
ncbi:MAG TPA: hypothetical protein VFC79_12940, partial [Tissierellaceae bacterium]|nr:hypothetical protein [Tissierellaceae bacterium]